MDQKHIRNFAIVAHVDHGKSTLADRLLEATGTIQKRDMVEQVLDSNPIERERGITIKLAPVRMCYRTYVLNLIDTPGHVDFSYEVSRALAACEGVLLVTDASQGIQAQTLAHMHNIRERSLTVIPIVNKIDLPTARVQETKTALSSLFGFDQADIIEISAKENRNIEKVLEASITRIPPPHGKEGEQTRALVFSSQYDVHRGVIVFVRVVDGRLTKKLSQQLKCAASGAVFSPVEIGVFSPRMRPVESIETGEVGYIATGLKDIRLARIGDTIMNQPAATPPLPGYREPKPMVYLSFFPIDADEYLTLRESLEKLHLSDSSFTYTPHASKALGKGFLCGFLGLLHAEIVRERLDREFAVATIVTAPTVEYVITSRSGQIMWVHTPEQFPDPSMIQKIQEPIMYVTIYAPAEYVGKIMQLATDRRGEYVNLEYRGNQTVATYLVPLSEMIVDFFDQLKSKTSGYASLDYEFFEMKDIDAVRLDILLNRQRVDAFSCIVPRIRSQEAAATLVEKLRELIPRHQFQIPIQAAIGGKIIARADVKSFRKDVTQKLYGGDRTRKDKLLDRQKRGKKRMRQFGNVEIPQDVFLSVFTKK